MDRVKTEHEYRPDWTLRRRDERRLSEKLPFDGQANSCEGVVFESRSKSCVTFSQVARHHCVSIMSPAVEEQSKARAFTYYEQICHRQYRKPSEAASSHRSSHTASHNSNPAGKIEFLHDEWFCHSKGRKHTEPAISSRASGDASHSRDPTPTQQ